ncbi:SDR family NAD(P)-dependent oxidoreductase [Micromonospora marina]|uniref:SDR family NAD(P)-dependent oxidoreductase n=1 Tax=Micromonospora marina TaxID=307120 RepID=UPI003D7057E1
MADVQSRFRLTHDDFVMRNHRLHEVSVLPGVVFFDLVYRTAVAAGWDHRRLCLRDTVLAEAIVTTDGFDREVVLTIGEPQDAGRPFTVRSRWLRGDDPVSGWHDNAHGLICVTDEPVPPPLDLAGLRAAADRHEDVDVLYRRAVREHIRHGPAMRCHGTLHIGGGALLADLTREQHPGATAAGFHLHPASLDASTLAGFGQVEMPTDDPFVPMFVKEFRAPEPLPPVCHVHVPRPERLAPSGDVITTDYTIRDADGRFLAGFTGLTCKRIRDSGLVRRLLADVSPDAAPVRPAPEATPTGQPAASSPGAANGFTDTLRAAVADMLGRPAAEVPTGTGFYDLGFDSVALLRLTERVEHLVGRKLYPTLLFEHTTIDALAAHLSTGPAPAVPQSSDAPVAGAAPAAPESAVLVFVDAWVPADPAPPSTGTPEALVVGGALPAGLTAAHVDSVDRLGDAGELPPAVVLLTDDPAADLWRAATALVDAGPRDLLVVHVGEPTAEQAATAALARTVTAEIPGLRCRFVQVDHARDLATAVRAELRSAGTEPEVRHAGGRRLVRRWREVDPAAGATGGEPFRDGGVYLITGGSGGLAAVLATHLARRHRARIALLSRTAPAAALVDRCRAAGAEVHVAIADVTDAAAVDAAVAGVRERFGRIDGVLHCAGVTRDGLFFRGDPGDLAAVAAPKLDGLRHVDAATAGDALDFLVAFSSASADVANPGQAAYAYANAGLRHVERRGRGRTVVIGWPYWAQGGMRAPADALRRSTERTGQEPMPTDTALGVLRDVLRGPYDAVLVLHGQPDRLRELVPSAGAAASTGAAASRPALGADGVSRPAAGAAAVPRRADGGPAAGEQAVGGPAPGGPGDDAVAVVGVAGRYPGADDLDAFWRNLAGGVDAITEVPPGRWDHAALFDPEKGTPGRTYGRWGGFLDGVDRFAPTFFGVSRRDAERMDPQERLFLTTCWHALENAGHPPETLRGEVVGVYAGVMWNHYQLVGGATDGVAPTAMHCAIPNRVSHTFDLTGPSLAVDTACSSSLIAVHLAVESIRRGECTLALAGGVNVTVHPQKYLQLAQGQWLSTDGRCRAFGADGTGYVPGEGVGAVLLKPLSRALADGDHVYGVIRATSVNHTGRTAGATVPSPGSQAALVRAALKSAGWTPATVGYVEAHGTGTALGDPIEVEGLRQAFDGADLPAGACAIGSVKSNIGHLEGAAGIAGLTKVLLQLRHRALVPSLHAGELNPHIDFAAVPLRVQRTLEPWTPPPGVPRRAGVSAFGAGGTNAHVLVEEFAPAAAPAPDGPALVVLSAPTAETLRAYAGAMAAGLPVATGPTAAVADLLGVPEEALEPSATLGDLGLDPARLADLVGVEAIGRLTVATRLDELAADRGVRDIAYTTQVGRAAQPVRIAVVTSGTEALRSALERFARDGDTGDVVTTGAPATGDPVAAFRAGELHEVARHWVGGGTVDWSACYPDGHPRRIPLPTCPLPEEPCWLGGWDAARAGADHAGTGGADHADRAGIGGGDLAGTGGADRAGIGGGDTVAPAAGPPPAVDGDVVVPDGPELEFRVLDQGVALVSMRAPMFTDGLLAALADTFAEIERRDDVRAVVITGHGSVFSMGGTPEALRSLAEGEGTFTDAALVYEGILRCTRPVVTAAAGHASGGGLAFACYGDVVVLGDSSVYSANFTRYGFTPGMGATYILEQRLGPALAAEMMLTGRSMTGAELSRRGAGVTVLPPHEVVPAALDLARSMADKPPAVVRSLKNELAGRILDRLPDVIASEVRMHGNVLGAESAALVREHFTKVDGFRGRATPAAQPEPGPDDGAVGDAVTEIVGALLYLRPDEVLPSRTFADLGLDSIGAVELVRDLNRRFGTDLDSAAVYDHPTVPDLARAVLRDLAESAALRAQATAAPAPSGVDEPVPAAAPAASPVTEAAARSAAREEAAPAAAGVTEPAVASPPAAGPPPLVLTASAAAPGTAPTPGSAPATASEPPPLTFAVRPPSASPSRQDPAPTGTPAATAAATPAPDTAPALDAPAAIAVIGMAGRFPGAPDLDTFWDNLAAGRSAIREVPPERWDLTGLYDPDPAAPGRTRSRWAALLDDVDAFDAGLFRISPLEAEAMDPQQRIFLEQAWAALEDAGYAGRPMRCGVFVGCGAGDYPRLLERHGHGDTSEAFLGGASSILPARIAYLLDLTGPTMAIDTACSSSLTAVYLACESLRSGDCDTALAGGVAVMCTPQMQVWTSQTGMLSPTGRCLPFDAAADGIVLGEGVGVVVLKRLDRALADGDHVHGVILAGGVNGDGRTNGITAPSAVSQVRLLREVHARAGVEAGYVETHGTGTALGDPIEVKALAQVVGPHCRIGSVKANIGHTTMAAGVAGLIKVLLSLRHRQLPPTPYATEPIPGLPVVRELTGWHDDRLVAGVSSFGFSGTNCHLVVAEAPAPTAGTGTGPVVVPVSARTASALRDLTDRLAERLRTEPADVHDVAATLAHGRAHLAVRAAFVAADTADLVRQLAGGPPATDAPADLVALAERWVAGADVDWTTMPAGRRIPLPTYPFARDRFWTGRDRRETALTPADPLVADHTLHGVPVLPGAAFLRQATAGGIARAADVTWLRPVVVSEPVTAVVTRDDRITLTVGGAPYAVATRRAADPAPPERVDLASVEARCPVRRPVDDLYAGFARAGLRYGPSFRVLTELRLGAGEALGTLTAGPDGDVQLLDGALQAVAGLVDPADRMLVPFAVESVFVADRLPATARVHVVRRDGGRFDVVLTDPTGDVRARLGGVALRPYDAPGTPSDAESRPVVAAPPAAGEPDLLYVPTWRPVDAPPGEPPAGRVLAVHTPADAALAAALGAGDRLPLGELPTGRYDTVYVLARTADPAAPPHEDTATLDAFRLLRRLLDLGADRGPLTLTFVVSGVAGLPGEPVHPHAAGLAGLASAIAAEYPQWRVTCVDAGPGDATSAEAIRRAGGTDRFVALRGDRRLVRRLEPVTGPAGEAPLRDGGVYLVVGGTGGIGFEVSRHLARTRRARLVWLGRSPEDGRVRSLAAQIEALGGQAVYLRADVTDAVAVGRAVAEARQRFGPVDGAFHAALVLRDRALSAMDEAAFTEVLRPKVAGVGVLADALAGEPLDFLALFSSALSFAPAPGQANYAAASTYEDAYGLALHRRGQPVRVVNWGWWGSVGVVADPGHAARFAALGIGSIEPAEGVAALERILAGPHAQVAVLKGTRDGLAALGVHPSPPADESVTTAPPATVGAATDTDPSLDRSSAAFRTLDGLARDLLRDRLRDRPGPASGPLAAAVAAAVARPPAGPSTADVLARHPDLAPHVALLARCVDALPGVLDGRTAPTEVLFPGGSTDLVAAVYQGQRAADFYHRLVAAQAAAVLDRTDGPGRVLEIGAGTGAGSAFVLDACPGVRYDFTDVSTAFLREAEDRFGGRHPGLRFGVLDIEREPAGQGFEAGSYDVVLATNVLHATADVVRSLRHARSLLRPGGVLLLNEVTRASDFLTATFGLLPGWWRFTDAHRRLPHSPLLSPAGWRAAFAEAGLTGRILGMPGVPDDEQEQCVLVATAGAPPVDRVPARAARDYVRAVFAEVLKYRPDQLDDDVTFDNFGVDSLVSQHLVRRFSADLGDLPATLLFEHLTIEQLADHLARERPGPLAATLGIGAADAEPAPVHPAALPAPAVPAASASAARGDADAIAVVGLSGRYPGAPDLERFWQNLVTGTTAITEVPPERWDWREHFDPRRGRPGHTYSRWAGFLTDVDRFDPGFFGILPKDAAAMDPQERLFLETVWLMLEDAGALGGVLPRDTGVFVGTMYGSYGRIAAAQGWPEGRYTDGHSAYWSIANRVSYTLDLTGPSFAVDSACSSSLTAVHLACESLRRGECSAAVAGGVNLVLHPAHLIALSSMTMLSADGACKVFDERADGFVPGEGVGAVLLKPLSAALRDGDRIWGVIEGGFVNSGGRTAGYTVPNPTAQADLVVRALAAAGVAPGDVGYLEAHGTGTALGDPIEIAGLGRALGGALPEGRRIPVGSVKANIGHLEGAAGIAGLTKVLLQLAHGTIAPCANLSTVNPRIDLSGSFLLPTSAQPWTAPRRAGISSFGAGGANTHLVVREHPAPPPAPVQPGPHVVVLSARTPEQLRTLTAALADMVERTRPRLDQLAYSTQVGRAEFDHRLAVVVSDVDELVRRLRSGEVVTGTAGTDPLFDGDGGAEIAADLLRRGRLDQSAKLWVRGVPVDWAGRWPVWPGRVSLPPYPFDRQRLWLPEPAGTARPPAAPSASDGDRTADGRDAVPPSPEAVARANPVPEAAVPETAVPETAVPETAVPETAVPGTVVPDAAAPETAVPDDDPCVYLRPQWRAEPPPEGGRPPARIRVIGEGPTFGGRHDQADPDVVVVHLPARAAGLADEVRESLHTVLRTAAEVLTPDPAAPLRIVVGCPDERPAYTAVTAALRTLALEHSGFSGAVVRGGVTAEADLWHVSGPPEQRVDDVRWTGGVREVRRMVPFRPGPVLRRTGGVYVVVGGTGAVGRHLAVHLAATRAPSAVVLVGRTAPADDAFAFVRADVTAESDVRSAVAEIRRRYGRIDGVIHAAGMHDDARALTKPPTAVDAVLAPKVSGLRHLVDALGTEPLEFLALCSSIAGRTGNLGQVDYAYANAFLDEFAAGRPGTVSVCWPLWADGGMAVDDATRRLFARRWGSAPLPTAEAVRAFDRVVSGTEPVVAVQFPAETAPESSDVPAGGPEPEPGPDPDTELRALAAGFLLVDPDEVDPDIQLLDLGFDSISLTELVNETNERFGVDLLPTVLYEHPTLAAFGAYLRTVLPARPAPATVDAGPAADRPAADAAEPPADLPADAVAVVGMAGVLPGSPDLDAFWRHLAAGDDLVRAVPADRTDLLGDPATAGVRAGFLDDVRSFDADLFGIAPREAALMDPQQRLFLQTAWQAVADAGYRPADLAGTDTGIFVGVSACDYDDLLRAHDVPVEAHTASGLADCILANRVSYLLDLRGPSEAVDTACSSSLVAVHRAVRALLAGECATALAGGVNVLLSPGLFVAFQSSGMLSADGRCKTFDASADGYGRGEGCGVVLLKPLRAAVADGDQVIAVIRGSAVNHAGRGPSLTAPNPQAQAQVVSRAYRAGGVDPASVSYIEAHGTGTRLGDPIEIEGLKKAFEGVDATIAVGTVKTNIGHLEAAAGIAGLLKVLLSLRHERLPRTLHQHRRNPYLRLDGTPFTVLDHDVPWTGDRVAGVSSFGFGGTNAHVVVQSPPPLPASPAAGPWRLVLSASGPAALAEYRRRVADRLAEGADMARVTYTLQVGREALAHRFAAVVTDAAEAVAVLRDEAPPRLDAEAETWLAGGDVDWAATWDHRPARISVPAPPLQARPFWFDEGPARAAVPVRPAPAEPPAPRVAAEPPAPVRAIGAGRIVLRDPSALRRNGTGRRTAADAETRNGGRASNGASSVGVLARPDAHPAGAGPAAAAPPLAPERRAAAVVVQEAAAAVPAAPAEVAEAVRDCVARVLGADRTEITADRAFADLGLDSIFRMELARLVVATFDVEVTAADLYEHDTVEAVAALVAAGTRAPRPATLGDGVEEIVTGVLERPVEPGRTFADSGLTSFDMLRVVGALEQRYGALPKTLLFDHPTMADLTAFLAGRSAATGVRTEPGAGPRATGRTIESGAEVDGEPVIVRKRTLPGRPALRDLLADLDRRHAKEGGLAGRDIAPYAFVDSARAGYVNFSVRGDDVFAWSFVGHHDHFHDLVAEWIAWARRHGLRPNFLSLAHLTEVAGEPVTATPFGAVQRLTDLASFTVRGGRMQRLRSLLHRFERAGDCRIEEYRAGASPETDRQIVGLIDSWGRRKQMVNPYVGVVREEIGGGTLDPRHRVFLTRVDGVLVNAVIVTRIPSERGYLLDLEFYADEMPAGGLEWAIVRIIELTAAEGCTSFSFGASFGVAITESHNADPAVADALAELHSVGVFGPGNFQFKNKFRPENTPIYLCQPATGDRTSVTDIILMIAHPDLVDGTPADPAPPSGAAAPPPRVNQSSEGAAPPADAGPPPDPALRPGRTDLLAAHGYNALALPTELVPFDLLTDSWAERADSFVAARTRLLAERPAPPELTAHDWLPMPEVVPTRSGRTAEELLCRCHPGPRGVVLHAAAFPTWLSTLADLGYEPVAVGAGRLDPDTIAAFAVELTRRPAGSVSFVVVEAANNAAGGVPVAAGVLRELRRVTAAHGVPLVLDASRVVDNAVQLAGPGGDPWPVVRDMLAVADTATLSLSKDFGVTAGGLVATRDPELAARLREHVARRGSEVDRATRMTLRAALADRDGVTELVRRRVAAVAVLRDGLRAAGLPVVDVDGAHCVLLDLARMPGLAGREHPTMSGLAWLYAGAGVRGGPHLAIGGPLAGTVRLALPVGFGPGDAEAVVAAVAGLTAAPGEIPDLVTGGVRTAGEAARAVYQPADRVPDDVRQALRDEAPADDNGTVLREHQPAVRRRVVPVAGVQVEVFTAGDGPPLLLAHPFNIGAGVFARQFEALAGRYQVISVHHPGVGASTASADLTLDGIAALQLRVLREIGVDGPVHVAGASFGGLVALTFALNHPEDTASLILLGSSYKIGNRVGEINRLAVVAAQDLDRTIEGSGADRLRRERAAVEALLLRCESMDPQTGLRYLDVFAARPDLRDRLGELDLPALVVQGRHDTVIPSETARLLHQGIRGARYAEIADAGHFPYLTSPQECNRILTDFLRGAGGEGS